MPLEDSTTTPTPTSHQEEKARYETSDMDECPARAYQGPSGQGNVGQRNETSIKNAFKNSPLYLLTPSVFQAQSKTKFSSYDAENTAYGLKMYKRNFIPVETGDPEYTNVRNKNLLPTEMGALGKPATPFSPNVASPSVPEGTLFVGANQITDSVNGLNITDQELPTAINELNPINTKYKNLDSLEHNDDVGSVRRFKLGIGSTIGKARTGHGQ